MGAYKSSDLSLAAFLTARGHKLVGVEGSSAHSVFCFEKSPELIADTLHWFNNTPTLIPARALFDGWRNLKGLAASY